MKQLQKDVAILKPGNGNSVVLISNPDYFKSLEGLFADHCKFQKIEKDPMVIQLLALQKYL